ncbi:pentapeptide repeat-containing protein [Microbispora amethystogenes]|uniref:Pentapeptide repeat-containing protein n=1 Tax=Microbispora amethystogenes TaxID=1427754 RepID=A0ABQ4FQ60_9ACTN|nr:pentapeptide repeat-containing protein [Microbispora amethystogenes]GIH36939.1 hypothetical protein Mam01_71030 [Microbispora amethystogenes]
MKGTQGLMTVAAVVVLAEISWLGLHAPGPEWLRWVVGLADMTIVTTLAMVALLGPGARWLAGEPGQLTARDRKRLSVKDRIDAVNTARATLLQAATGIVVVGGLGFTGAGLVYTARTLDVSAKTLDATREGQVTDRYTKAVEQLGSPKIDVRLGGIYALQRLAADSDRDRATITEVLNAYVQVHAHPSKMEITKGQALVDVAAALRVTTELNRVTTNYQPRPRLDLTAVDFHASDLSSADLAGVNLTGASMVDANMRDVSLTNATLKDAVLQGGALEGADLSRADLNGGNLIDANLIDASLSGTRMVRATLTNANLLHAHLEDALLPYADLTDALLLKANLDRVNLDHANLTRAVLQGANLTDAKLTGANLTGANLTNATLTGADLTGANLSYLIGKTPAEIKAVARTNSKTKFSP